MRLSSVQTRGRQMHQLQKRCNVGLLSCTKRDIDSHYLEAHPPYGTDFCEYPSRSPPYSSSPEALSWLSGSGRQRTTACPAETQEAGTRDVCRGMAPPLLSNHTAPSLHETKNKIKK